MTVDVRSVANFVLEVAQGEGVGVTNLSLNKIIYFLHAESLARFDKPLVKAKIEAWKYGPVFREVYSSFKDYGSQPITSKATRVNKFSGEKEVCTLDAEEHIGNILADVCRSYLKLTSSQLVTLSHARGGAWDEVFNHMDPSNPGMSITDEVIRRNFAPRTFH